MPHLPKSSKNIIRLAMVLLGNLIYALTVTLFIVPANVISAGTTGIALTLQHYFAIPMSGFVLVFNMVMLGVGWLLLGKSFALTTLLSSLIYPVLLAILTELLGDVVITQSLLLNVLFGGMGLGLSLGLVIRAGASTGGMDIPPLVLKRFFHIPVSVSLWTFDFFIMLLQLSFHTGEDLLYGIIMLITISVMLNKIMLFGTSRTEVKIISRKADEIRTAILSRVDRGVTMLNGQGGYLQLPTQIILSIVSNHELPRIEQLAREIDPDSFVIVSRVTEVWGRGFTYAKNVLPQQDENTP